MMVYEITWDIGHDSCRFQKDLLKYTKIIPDCFENSGTFVLSKIGICFFGNKKIYMPRQTVQEKHVLYNSNMMYLLSAYD